MRTRNLLWSSLALVLMISGTTAATAASAGAKAVTAAEYQWLKAMQSNNMDLLVPLLDERMVYTSEDNVVFGKAAAIASFKADIYSSADYKDFKVTQFGDTAIATGTFIGKVAHAGGKPRDVRLRFTDTWIRIAKGKWLCVATQD